MIERGGETFGNGFHQWEKYDGMNKVQPLTIKYETP